MSIKDQFPSQKQTRWILFSVLLIVVVMLLGLLGNYFPYTGLAAIVVIPFIFILVLIIGLLTVRITRNIQISLFISIWLFSYFISFLLTLSMYPQEFRPNVVSQIGYSISVINNIDKISESDLELPYKVIDFSRENCRIKDSQERYVAALFKYRYQIPLDGSFHIYRQEKRNANPDEISSIRKLEDIPKKLRTRQEKLIWNVLERN